MAKPFYSSGESFRMRHEFLSCYSEVDISTSSSLLFDFYFSASQVISSLSDYIFGYAMMHSFASNIEKTFVLSDTAINSRRIYLNEYLISSFDRKLLRT